ncbi:hypothetical protein BBI01_10555 [Chryseobacterium artocarpi]|uniref:FUSC family protein n=2 Tax=Chryseobacterium TaxID=59732 RepID=A0A1N7NVY5_9FLAO|nr:MULTISPECIES: hypothetical protein [Chryseobacterium]OCA72547.1 hypothetical protein BBI01_10555 [Chryseobacterium artocarpi]SIT02451.1 hypothetical protein SAMN05421786_104109 [Chryseobacterium ureilyticum]
MKEKDLSELTDQELLDKKQKLKSGKIINAVLIGFLIGIAVYSSVKHGIGFFTIFPLIFVLILTTQWKKNDQSINRELESRNLK